MKYMRHLFKNKPFMLTFAFILFWTPVIIFLKIAGEIIEKEPLAVDAKLLTWIHAQSNSFLDQVFLFATNLGGVASVLGITILLLAYLIYKKQRHHAFILAASVGGGAVANVVLKALFHRDRPSLWPSLAPETSFSFPSGHAMLSSALILSIIVILWNTRFRYIACLCGVLLIGTIGISRIYLGVHYPSDVIAGWCVSAAWVFIVVLIAKYTSYRLHRA